MIKNLENKLQNDSYITLVSMSKKLLIKPNFINELKLKNLSFDKKYQIIFAKKIIKDYQLGMQDNKSFALTKKRFIAPHQFLMAKVFLKNNEK